MPTLNRMYRAYGGKGKNSRVHFLLVYIREAHPSDGKGGWPIPGGPQVKQPTVFGERKAVARSCAANLKVAFPVAIDGMDNRVDASYRARPDRLALVAKGGKLVYYGGRGPFGFRPAEAEKALKKELRRLARIEKLANIDPDAPLELKPGKTYY